MAQSEIPVRGKSILMKFQVLDLCTRARHSSVPDCSQRHAPKGWKKEETPLETSQASLLPCLCSSVRSKLAIAFAD